MSDFKDGKLDHSLPWKPIALGPDFRQRNRDIEGRCHTQSFYAKDEESPLGLVMRQYIPQARRIGCQDGCLSPDAHDAYFSNLAVRGRPVTRPTPLDRVESDPWLRRLAMAWDETFEEGR